MIEQSFYSVLMASTAVTALTGYRIYPLVVPEIDSDIPLSSQLPAIDYAIIGGSAYATLTTTGWQKYRVEVNCWGSTYSTAVTLRDAVIANLNGYLDTQMSIQLIQPQDFFDHDLLQYRAMVEFYVYFTYSSSVGVTPAIPVITPPSTSTGYLTLTTATTISQYLAVTTAGGLAIVADTTVPTSAAIGIAATGAMSGSTINVQCNGELTNSGWTWTDGLPIYVGVGGALTQTSPSASGTFQQVVGYAISATAMVIDIQEQIIFG